MLNTFQPIKLHVTYFLNNVHLDTRVLLPVGGQSNIQQMVLQPQAMRSPAPSPGLQTVSH